MALTVAIGLRTAALATAVLLGSVAAASARDLALRLRANADAAALRSAMLDPFSASSGVVLAIEGWPGGLDALRSAAAAAPVDVVLATAAEVQDGCDTGMFDRLDWQALGGRDRLAAYAASDCGLGALHRATVLAWDRDKSAAAPGWVEFWDVVRAPGKRGLRLGARGNLEFALLADGVAPADVYRILRGEAGVERAFRKLDQIRPYVVWWSDDDQAARILASGEVLMTSAPAAAIRALNRADGRNLGLQWTGALGSVAFWARLRGSDNGADIARFLSYAAEPRNQARLAEAGPYGALARDAAPPEGYAATLPADEAFWRENGPRIAARFDAWIAR